MSTEVYNSTEVLKSTAAYGVTKDWENQLVADRFLILLLIYVIVLLSAYKLHVSLMSSLKIAHPQAQKIRNKPSQSDNASKSSSCDEIKVEKCSSDVLSNSNNHVRSD
uniref:Uncharacterized protein n=1 Tax=Glossina brevipalpis TaxID=37001 RepID=A0A1A9WQG8_9MUSC